MIITVTMNPAIDKTVSLSSFQHGGLNRLSHIVRDAGGKGINVSKTLPALGTASLAVGFIAGSTGHFIEKSLHQANISTDFIEIEGETRTNTKVVEPDGTTTDLNEPGPAPSEHDIALLIEKLVSYANPDTLFVLSGSVPAGTDPAIYRTITEKVHAKGASVLLDADGPLFSQALKAAPDMIKPNRSELEQYFGVSEQSDDPVRQSAALGRTLLSYGVHTAAVSLGEDGALFLSADHTLYCPALSMNVCSTVGAGDAMVAALAYGWEQHLSLSECALLGMAASAGAVTTVGTKPPSADQIDTLKKQVIITELSL